MRQKNKDATPEEIAEIKRLSVNNTPRKISEQTGISYSNIINIQRNPKYGIENPFRPYSANGKLVKLIKSDFFDVDEYARIYIY
jgi:hypothetical protein